MRSNDKPSKKRDDEWQRAVCERDGYVCQISGRNYSSPCYFDETGKNLYVCGHHIKSKRSHPELRYDLDNGVCLDFEHHEKLHRGLVRLNQTSTTPDA